MPPAPDQTISHAAGEQDTTSRVTRDDIRALGYDVVETGACPQRHGALLYVSAKAVLVAPGLAADVEADALRRTYAYLLQVAR